MKTLWPVLLFDATAALWVVPAVWALSTWMHAGAPRLLLFLCFTVVALVGRRSVYAAAVCGALAAGLAALLTPAAPNFPVAVFALLPMARAITLPRSIVHWSMRLEFRRGITVWVVIALVRAIVGTPAAGPLALMVLLFFAAGLVGLPLLHSVGVVGPGPDAVRRALPGLRVSLLVGMVGGWLAVLIWGIGVLLTGTRLTALGQLLFSVLNAVSYVLISPFEHLISYLHAQSHPLKLSTPPTKVKPTSPKALSALGHSSHVALIVGGIVVILAIATGAVLAARRRREEMSPDNRPASPLDILFETVTGTSRVRLDLGQGARRVVRTAVWRHLLRAHRGKLPSSATARRLAAREGWTGDALDTYERARYRLRQNFDASIARRFLQNFRPHRGKKDQT